MVRDVLAVEDVPLIEWQLLFSVARFGTCHLAYITRHTSLDPAHGSRAAKMLEKKGLIERHDDPNNRRRKLISLTPHGEALFNRIWPRAQAMITSVTDTLDRADFEEVKRLLDLLNAAADLLQAPNETGNDQRKTQQATAVTA